MKKVIKNGTVISMNQARDKFEKADVVIDDDKISEIVSEYKGEADVVIDATRESSNSWAYKLSYASSE